MWVFAFWVCVYFLLLFFWVLEVRLDWLVAYFLSALYYVTPVRAKNCIMTRGINDRNLKFSMSLIYRKRRS